MRNLIGRVGDLTERKYFCCHCGKYHRMVLKRFTGIIHKGQEVWEAVCGVYNKSFSDTLWGHSIVLI